MTIHDLVSLLVGNTVVAMALALVALLAGRASRPALAHAAWLLVLVKLITPPLWRVPVMEGASQTRAVSPVAPSFAAIAHEVPAPSPSPPPAAANVTAAVADTSATLPESAVHVAALPASPSVDWRHVVLGTWMGGSLVFLLIATVRVWRFGRTLRGARDVDASLRHEIEAMSSQLGLARPPRTCVVPAAVSPMLWFLGVGRPRLVLPAALLETMSPEQRAGVIAHELAHLRRRDHWVRLFELPVTVALWFHPLVWITRRGLREAEEQCCDAWAVFVLPAGRRAYADALVNAMESIARPARLPLGATGLGRLATLRKRLTMIIAQPPPRSLSLTGRFAVAVLLAAVAILPVRGQAQAPQPTMKPAKGDLIGVNPGASIQVAIDKAPEGATIFVDAGVYPESITIAKPITLTGAGWDRTIIGPDKAGTLSQQQKDEFFRKLEATTDPEQRARIAIELAAGAQPPTITVKNAPGVSIAGIRVRGPQTGNPGGVNPNETLVRFDNAARASMKECAIVGPSSNGVSIVNGSDVRIEKSLVAAVWGTGIQVFAGERGGDAKPAKVHLVDTDIRNCHHRCVTITGEGSVIERCRISGSAWHGIRYDNCSPTIKDNHIFGNARSGIYASGKTAAKVSGNVFWRNEMDAMSCWFNNADVVEGNTIVGNLREGISVLGDSETKLTKNLFAGNPVGVMTSQISGEAASTPQPVLSGNVFWDNPEDYQVLGKPAPLPAGNEKAAPTFASVERKDFALPPDSPARKLGAGAAEPIPFASPFPIQPQETAMVPDTDTRDYDKWKKPAEPTKAGDAQPASAPTSKSDSPMAAPTAQRDRQRNLARARMRKDSAKYSRDQIAEAEALYQVANKNWRGDEARASLKTMIERFPGLNRTGCAVLYLAQWSRGDERERLLKQAIDQYGDCYYGNGVQVAAFARYLLGHYYREQGKTAEADKLFDEIRKNYPDAITHGGDALVAVMREEAKAGATTTQPAR